MSLETVKKNKSRVAGIAVLAIAIVIIIGAGSLHVSPLSWGWYQPYNTDGDLALAGYDAVAYHTTGVATAGSESVSCVWSGVTWRFASDENRELFVADPERYAPQFGGHCAKAVAAGFTAKTDPEAWHIADGKLYVFADSGVMEEWVAAVPRGALSEAETSWSEK